MEKISRFLRKYAVDEINVYAANASFFILLSVFPVMMLAIGLLQFTPLSPDDLQKALSNLMPEALNPLLDYMVQELFSVESAATVSVSGAAALWIASKGVYSFQKGLNKVYHAKETRNYLLVRLRCTLYTVLLLLALILTAVLHLSEQRLVSYLDTKTEPLFRFLAAVLRMKYLVIVSLLTLLFSVLYVVFPNRKISFTASLPGAFFAAVLWVVFSQLFSYYVIHFGHYSLYYGSLSVIALAMLWLYCCISFLFYGGVLNCILSSLRSAPLQQAS